MPPKIRSLARAYHSFFHRLGRLVDSSKNGINQHFKITLIEMSNCEIFKMHSNTKRIDYILIQAFVNLKD
jgi:hypothetical protein